MTKIIKVKKKEVCPHLAKDVDDLEDGTEPTIDLWCSHHSRIDEIEPRCRGLDHPDCPLIDLDVEITSLPIKDLPTQLAEKRALIEWLKMVCRCLVEHIRLKEEPCETCEKNIKILDKLLYDENNREGE